MIAGRKKAHFLFGLLLTRKGWSWEQEKVPPTYLMVASHCWAFGMLALAHMVADKGRHPKEQLTQDAEQDIEQR